MKKLIGVIGARECPDSSLKFAYEVGQEIAKHSYGLVSGGMMGTMEAASKGCRDNGGLTVGILPGDDPSLANPYLDIIIPTGMGIMRNLLIVRSAVGLIAIDGKYGTLSEIAYALQVGKPIVGLNTWDISEDILKVNSAHEAVETIIKLTT
ncbi:MAG: TIGR00725 family protein [Calditrichaceae bacterium]|nr:TIGR00725 family protein [Calditrichaceae bacterium]